MGTTQSYVSAAVVAGAIGFGYHQLASSGAADSSALSEAEEEAGAGKKSKGKKKQNITSGTSTPVAKGAKTPENVSILPFPAVVPGQFDDRASDSSAGSGAKATASSSKAKKGKKKKAGKVAGAQDKSTTGLQPPAEESVVLPAAASALADSVVDSVTTPSAKSINKSKKKKQQGSSQASSPSAGTSNRGVSAPSKADSAQRLQMSTASIASLATDTDGEWTRVSRRADKISTSTAAGGTSDVGQTTSVTTGTSSPVDTRTEEDEDGEQEDEAVLTRTGEQNALAKRLLPKSRKTGVEDMLATSDYPSYSRVMRVQPGDKPASGFSWGDYEDVVGGDSPNGEPDADGTEADREDDGWGVVKRGGRPKNKAPSSQQSLATTTSRTTSAPETMTKRQRQNAAKREAEKSAKAEVERERLAALARHKRELERAEMDAQFGKSVGKNATSGGMKATVDEKGKLVWD
ncbi:hypothetical protein J3R30DRAFT_3446235 [Lentinula aciculospora]|uniref:Uncharacterized protein n=1 Tax=Lentinula aciculospora TaxID=153920 RepID=A0A9W9DTR7_9AGAR|nr:hypothetical protein J3R30DRAFT_3446235 [Lentinula aciculospora]